MYQESRGGDSYMFVKSKWLAATLSSQYDRGLWTLKPISFFPKFGIARSPRRCSRAVMEKFFMACALACFLGCGSKKGAAEDTTSADVIKTPATVEEAMKVLDLSTFPLMDGAKHHLHGHGCYAD